MPEQVAILATVGVGEGPDVGLGRDAEEVAVDVIEVGQVGALRADVDLGLPVNGTILTITSQNGAQKDFCLRVALIVTIRNVWDYHLVIEEINELKSLQVD